MRSLFYVISMLAVIGLAFWSYQENYKTRASLKSASNLQIDIGKARQSLAILRAEWAYLNRPDRLRELTNINFDSLGLLPLTPGQFGRIDQVSYPSSQTSPILNALTTSAEMGPNQ